MITLGDFVHFVCGATALIPGSTPYRRAVLAWLVAVGRTGRWGEA